MLIQLRLPATFCRYSEPSETRAPDTVPVLPATGHYAALVCFRPFWVRGTFLCRVGYWSLLMASGPF